MVQDAAPAAAATSYTFRERVGESIRIELNDQGVRYRSTKAGTIDASWARLRRIGLISPMPGVHVCVLETTDGKQMLLANRSMAEAGQFREQNSAFLDFVWKLHARAAEHANIRFRSGHAGWFYFAVVTLVLLACLLLALIGLTLFSFVAGKLGQTLPFWAAGALVFVTPVLVHWARKNRVRTYDPHDIPPELIPERGDE